VSEPWVFSATPVRVVDGDTYVLSARLYVDLERRFVVRVLGIDTPELRSPATDVKARALAAKRFAEARLFPGGAAIPVELRLEGKRDVYGRELGVVIIGGVSLADLLIQAGLGDAKDYGSHLAALAAED
jgi:micrococcal nuclease